MKNNNYSQDEQQKVDAICLFAPTRVDASAAVHVYVSFDCALQKRTRERAASAVLVSAKY